jgi:transposase
MIYTEEFKERAVELARSSGRQPKEIAKELGVPVYNIRRWIRAVAIAEEEGQKAFPGHGKPRDEELAALRKKVADLEETNEILKKAMAIFAEKKPR